MIDYIKTEVLGVDIQSIQQEKGLDFSGQYHLSGEVDIRRLYAKYKEMKITIHENRRVFLEGSLPVMIQGNNYENLKYTDFIHGVEELESLFGVTADNINLQNFEFGFSVDIGDKSPTDFLLSDLIDYNGEIVNTDTYKKNGFGITFRKCQYHLKLYDKKSQYNLDKNILRIEIRVKKMQYVKKIKIKTLKDLVNRTNWYDLKKRFVREISELVVCSIGHDVDITSIPKQDFHLIFTWRNPDFWIENKPKSRAHADGYKNEYYQKMKKLYDGKKLQFKRLISKYGLDKTKKNILQQVHKEYMNVLPTPSLKEEYENGLPHLKRKHTPRDIMYRRKNLPKNDRFLW